MVWDFLKYRICEEPFSVAFRNLRSTPANRVEPSSWPTFEPRSRTISGIRWGNLSRAAHIRLLQIRLSIYR